MRFAPVVLALPAMAAAQQQVPLFEQAKGWFNNFVGAATSNVNSASSAAASAASGVPNPVHAAAGQVEQLAVTDLTKENYNQVLKPGAATASPGIEDWMIYTTGGNRTCFGMCARADVEWSKAVSLLSAVPSAPQLGRLDCEKEPQLCNAWGAGAPSVIYMQLPQPLPDQTTPATTVHFIALNRTTVSAQDIVEIATEKAFKQRTPYEGFFHPFDGVLAKTGLGIPFGWVVYGFSVMPSWALMIGISFFSRTFIKRMGPQGGAAARPAAAAPAGRTQ
ncbi:unnamed protein product [Aureobasidium vineae]|uniref:Peptidyl-tRNA hydrolase n=2 Tax=Aureobasidium TaxID=5579 RepID=A0A9N8JB24_9PEZI|nr:unnamed protein product [Aureobasidium vineae]CAD0110737.1 unnamed protein product [Aureobasidium uvarum]